MQPPQQHRGEEGTNGQIVSIKKELLMEEGIDVGRLLMKREKRTRGRTDPCGSKGATVVILKSHTSAPI